MLCIASALVGNEVRRYIEWELGGVRATSSKLGIYIHLVALARSLHCALTVSIIPVVCHKAIIVRGKETVLLIPFEFTLCGLLVSHAILLCTACIDIYKITVGIIPVVSHKAIVIRSKETVLLIPFKLALCGLLVSHTVLLCTACVDINKITVGIILISMIVVHILAFWRCLLRSVVHILHFCKLGLLASICSVCIG